MDPLSLGVGIAVGHSSGSGSVLGMLLATGVILIAVIAWVKLTK